MAKNEQRTHIEVSQKEPIGSIRETAQNPDQYTIMLPGALKDGFRNLTPSETRVVRLSFILMHRETFSIEITNLDTIASNLGIPKEVAYQTRERGLKKLTSNARISALAILYSMDEGLQEAYDKDELKPAVSLLRYVQKANGDSPIPSGVKIETFKFLQAAKASGSFEKIDEDWQEVINTYYSTDVGIDDLVRDFGKGSNKTLRKHIVLKLGDLWDNLPPYLQEMCPKGEAVCLKTKAGRRHTPETLAKMSKVQKGKIITPEARRKLSIAKTGFSHSLATKLEMSRTRTGKSKSPETRARIAEGQRRRIRERQQAKENNSVIQCIQIYPEATTE